MILLPGRVEGGLDLAYSGPQAAVRGAHWSLLMFSKQVSILSVTVLQSTAAPHTGLLPSGALVMPSSNKNQHRYFSCLEHKAPC